MYMTAGSNLYLYRFYLVMHHRNPDLEIAAGSITADVAGLPKTQYQFSDKKEAKYFTG